MNNKVFLLVLSGVLCAIGMVVPMLMPKIVLGPMSFTLASHVAVFLAMFISPFMAVAVCMGTTLGFFLTTPLIIALRAASHIVFAFIGAVIVKKNPDIIEKTASTVMFNIFLAVLHAVAEVAVVTPFFLSGEMFSLEQLTNGYLMSVVVLVGCGTFIHSCVDYFVALFVWKPLSAAIPEIRRAR